MLAIFLLKCELVIWPTGELRKMIYLEFNNIRRFNNIIGAIDNIYIILRITLLKQSKIYWNCKKKYLIQY